MTEMNEQVQDALEGSPIIRDVLGDAADVLKVFHVKLREEGEKRGIIGPRDNGIIWERHILNSAAIVPFIREATQHNERKTVADVGSGGGFPGLIAAACLPDHVFTLIEPMERRCEWLNECVTEMGLNNVVIMRARSEEVIATLARDAKRPQRRHRRRHDQGDAPAMVPFAVVTCRAVAPMTKLAGWTLPLLQPHGYLIALKGRSAQAELDKAATEIRHQGGMRPQVMEAPVAPGLESTHVVVVEKR